MLLPIRLSAATSVLRHGFVLAVPALFAAAALGGAPAAPAAASADIKVTKGDSPDPVNVGATLTYNVTVKNLGPSVATAVTMRDTLPSSVSFVSVTTTKGSCTGTSSISCAIGTLGLNALATVKILVRPNAAVTIANTATASASEADPKPANNASTVSTTVKATSGALDSSFSGDGKVTTDFGGPEYGHDVAIQSDGKIVVAGQKRDEFALARYTTTGNLDAGFGAGGKVTTRIPGCIATPYALAIQPDGKIVAAGYAVAAVFGGPISPCGDFALARYNANGTLDHAFGSGGIAMLNFSPRVNSSSTNGIAEVALQPDGRIVAVGNFHRPDLDVDFAVARFLADGTVDPTFGTAGRVTTDFDPTRLGDADNANGVAIDAAGRIVVAGRAGGGGFAVARYLPTGALDPKFGTVGLVRTQFDAEGLAVALQPDGKIVVAGQATTGPNTSGLALARYDASGALDPAFGTGGLVTTTTAAPGSTGATGVAIQADGKIVAAGWDGPDFAVARYTAAGVLDLAFGGGVVTTDFGGVDEANGVAIQADGRIVAAGRGSNGPDFALARYHP